METIFPMFNHGEVYFISMFSVAQDTESRIFYVIVFLFLAYRKYEFCIESDEIR